METRELLQWYRDDTEYVARRLTEADLRPVGISVGLGLTGKVETLRVQIAGRLASAACEVLGPPSEIEKRDSAQYPAEAIWRDGAVEVIAVLTQAERLDVERWIADRYESAPAVVAAEAR